jgi:hypothetical protein
VSDTPLRHACYSCPACEARSREDDLCRCGHQRWEHKTLGYVDACGTPRPFGRIRQLAIQMSARGNVVDSQDVADLTSIMLICESESRCDCAWIGDRLVRGRCHE